MTIKPQAENELELKIKLAPRDLEKVFRALFRKEAVTPLSRKFLSREYFDTPDLKLFSDPRRISLRVQYKPGDGLSLGGYEQTLKYELKRGQGGLLRREARNPLDGPLPDLSRVSDEKVRKIIAKYRKEGFIHIFSADIERRYFEAEADGGRIELAFDVGNIVIPGQDKKVFPLSEIEIELKKGNKDAIAVFCNKILKASPAAYIALGTSKAAEGTELFKKYGRYKK